MAHMGRRPLRSCGRGHRGTRPRSGRSRQAVVSLTNHPPQAPSLTRGLRRMDTIPLPSDQGRTCCHRRGETPHRSHRHSGTVLMGFFDAENVKSQAVSD